MSLTFNFTVAPHLEQYNIPFADFRASNSDLTHFVGGGLIFSQTASPTQDPEKGDQPLRILLLQRSSTDSYGGHWEGPGGSCEPDDETLLTGVAREVFEESGLHVSRFIDFVAKDKWVSLKSNTVLHVAKFTFIVEVHTDVGNKAASGRWEDCVKTDPEEHQAFEWVTEEELRQGQEEGTGKYRCLGEQAKTLVAAFQLMQKPSS